MLSTPKEALSDFLNSLDQYEQALPSFSTSELLFQPDEDSWSMGQMYNHLLDGTRRYHLAQVGRCLENQENQDQGMTENGRKGMEANSFPPIKIKVPASPTYTPLQPSGAAELQEKMKALRAEMEAMGERLSSFPESGKLSHFAFGYLDAFEWYQLIAMHFRHHLRQKEELTKLALEKRASGTN